MLYNEYHKRHTKKSDTKSNKAFFLWFVMAFIWTISQSSSLFFSLLRSLTLQKWLNKNSRRFGPFVHPQWAIIKYKVIANIAFIGIFISNDNWPKKGSTNHKTTISLWKHYFYPECIEWHWLYRYTIRIRFFFSFL